MGSEMCIRDRNGGVQCQLLKQAGVPERLIEQNEGVSHDRVVDLALAGRLKYFLAEEDLVEVGLKERGLPLDRLKVVYTLEDSVGDYLAISRNNDPELVNLLQEALSRILNH